MRLARALEAALLSAMLTAGCSGGDDGGGGGNGGEPPIADAGDDAAVRIYQPRALNGSQSEDPEGKPLTFAWTVLGAPDGSAAALTSGGAAAIVSFTPDAEGSYLFGLVVSDGKKASALDTVEINVTLQVAVFGAFDDAAPALDLAGAGDVDDYTGYPVSFVTGGSDGVVLVEDYRFGQATLMAYYTFDGTQELLAGGDIWDSYIDGNWVVWRENRTGQVDLFARNLATGAETRVTNTTQMETVGNFDGEVVTWEEVRDPSYGVDVFAFDLVAGQEIQVSPLDLGIDETSPRTDGATVVFTAQNATPDAFAFDLAGQNLMPLAINTTDSELALGVSGDFAILTVDTGSGPQLIRQRLSNGNRFPITTANTVDEVAGDYALYSDLGGLHAFRFSTNAIIDITTSWEDADLADGTVVWTDFNVTTSSDDVFSKGLPAGAVQQITATTEDEEDAVFVGSGVAWWETAVNGLQEAYFTPDLGTTVEHASGGKVLLADRVDEYDVAIVSSDVDPEFQALVLDALSSAGVPILSFNRDGFSVAEAYAGDTLYNLAVDSAQCGPATVMFNAADPALAGFAPGTYSELERFITSADYAARSFDVFAGLGTPPEDWTALATHAANPNTCPIGGETVIASFTNDDGTMVILDGTVGNYLEFWEPSRHALTIAELRYLAATRAP